MKESILAQIAAHKREEVEAKKRSTPVEALTYPFPLRDFVSPLQNNSPAIIAEIKKASPSKGIIREDFNVKAIAKIYSEHGASCLSVLTDSHFFQGADENIALAKSASGLPILRKDFILDPYQIYESRSLGADCILLIVAMLEDAELLEFCQLSQELGMAVLVESHTAEELERALVLPTPLMGINNRSLHTFKTDLACTITLASSIPKDKVIISESGINSRDDLMLLQQAGITRFLIGESLMRAENIGQALEHLVAKTN